MHGHIIEAFDQKTLYLPRWFSGRASVWSTKGFGFDPRLRHTKSRQKMVSVSTLAYEVSAGKHCLLAQFQLIM